MTHPVRHPKAPVLDGRLLELEAVIKRGERVFIQVGTALAEIQERKLYKSRGFSSFADYVQEHLGWGRSRAYQMIEAAKTAETVHKVDIPYPLREVQVRELARAGEAAPEVWQRVVTEHGPEAPASVVRAMVVDVIDPGPSEPEHVEAAAIRELDPRVLDYVAGAAVAAYKHGYTLPEIQNAIATAIGDL